MTEHDDMSSKVDMLEQLLMDSKSVVLDFADIPDEAERQQYVGLIRFWYSKMGGGSMTVSELSEFRVRMEPVDDPASNLIY